MRNLFEGSICLTNINTWTWDSGSTRMWSWQYLHAVVWYIHLKECITLVRLTGIIMVKNSIVGQFWILLNASTSFDYNIQIVILFFSYPFVLEGTQKVLVQIGYIFLVKYVAEVLFPFVSGIVLYLEVSCTDWRSSFQPL